MASDPVNRLHTVRAPSQCDADRRAPSCQPRRRPTATRAVGWPQILGAVVARRRPDDDHRHRDWPSSMMTTAVGVLSVGLPDPSQLEALTFSQPTVVYDRSGTVELGRFQREERRVVAFDDVPQLVLDATTTRRGPDLLGEQRVRRAGHPGGRRGRRERDARARRLDDHPAAGPCAAAAVRRDRGRRRPLHAQGQGADPVDARLRDLPRRGGQGPRSSPPTSTRSSTATVPTGSRPRPRSTSASPTWPS